MQDSETFEGTKKDCNEPIPNTERQLTRFAAYVELDDLLDTLGAEELAVLVQIAKRLQLGQHMYGLLHVRSDPRAFRSKEAREELEDALVYLACAWLKAEGAGVQR
jgi:hypothetical protein